MQMGKLADVTGKEIRSWYEWLQKEQMGCSSICFDADDRYRYVVCMGWHQTGGARDYEIAWKIGRQTHNNVMQCDFDVDFEMPYDEKTGEVDDTCEVITLKRLKHGCIGYPRDGAPQGYRSWDSLATHMRKTARRVFRQWKEEE